LFFADSLRAIRVKSISINPFPAPAQGTGNAAFGGHPLPVPLQKDARKRLFACTIVQQKRLGCAWGLSGRWPPVLATYYQ
jgi:hypothetical protein